MEEKRFPNQQEGDEKKRDMPGQGGQGGQERQRPNQGGGQQRPGQGGGKQGQPQDPSRKSGGGERSGSDQ